MLQNAAQRGVRVNIVIYKEVPQALPRMYTFCKTSDCTDG